jgi:serine/threonine protein kinase
VELLGRGGMGEVWRARDARLKRDVAIKVLPAGLARDPDRIARFEREARAAGALNHPNIVAVYDIGCDNGTYWIASELVHGDTLRRAIERGPLPAPKAIEIAMQVAAGLAAAHAAGLVHRDLKPANIMVTRDGQVKILDFGLAKQRHDAQDSTITDLTDEGVVMGTAGYMSPEQVRGEAVDHRSDLFSFGVVLYEMLCGKRAFAGASSVEVMNAILKEDPPELPASVPPALGRIVRRCLEKEPARRFQSAADLGIRAAAIVARFAARGSAPAPGRADVGTGGRVRNGPRRSLSLAEPSLAPAANHRHGPDHQRRPGKRRAHAHRRYTPAFQPHG